MRDIDAPKFIERSGAIKPYYDVTIRSKSWFSDGKRDSLRTAVEDPAFRQGLISTLNLAVLLQAPLYIGKAIDLRQRIGTHLKEGSTLRERLNQASVDLDRTLLLLLPNPLIGLDRESELADLKNEPDEEAEGCLEEDEVAPTGHEELYEEIYSRLFNPQFTIRLG
ncbi:hypothetical protein [Luteolibacter marinus]|uniref:hypothetical protein n=1 Tax=Luteolibacter marinus TaxID=2776705 RepID=UPI0018685078|nr:hypothetical protein [Luteolibacter marinus]